MHTTISTATSHTSGDKKECTPTRSDVCSRVRRWCCLRVCRSLWSAVMRWWLSRIWMIGLHSLSTEVSHRCSIRRRSSTCQYLCDYAGHLRRIAESKVPAEAGWEDIWRWSVLQARETTDPQEDAQLSDQRREEEKLQQRTSLSLQNVAAQSHTGHSCQTERATGYHQTYSKEKKCGPAAQWYPLRQISKENEQTSAADWSDLRLCKDAIGEERNDLLFQLVEFEQEDMQSDGPQLNYIKRVWEDQAACSRFHRGQQEPSAETGGHPGEGETDTQPKCNSGYVQNRCDRQKGDK